MRSMWECCKFQGTEFDSYSQKMKEKIKQK
jgi:hypothetical protein